MEVTKQKQILDNNKKMYKTFFAYTWIGRAGRNYLPESWNIELLADWLAGGDDMRYNDNCRQTNVIESKARYIELGFLAATPRDTALIPEPGPAHTVKPITDMQIVLWSLYEWVFAVHNTYTTYIRVSAMNVLCQNQVAWRSDSKQQRNSERECDNIKMFTEKVSIFLLFYSVCFSLCFSFFLHYFIFRVLHSEVIFEL